MADETFTIVREGAAAPIRFRCAGELDMARAPRIAEALDAIDDDLVLDCAGLVFLDSAGIGALIAQQARLQGTGHHLRLANVDGQPRRTLELAGLLDAFG